MRAEPLRSFRGYEAVCTYNLGLDSISYVISIEAVIEYRGYDYITN